MQDQAQIAKDPEVTAMLKRMEENISTSIQLVKQLSARLAPVLNATATVLEKTADGKQSTVPMVQCLEKYNNDIKAINGVMSDTLSRLEV